MNKNFKDADHRNLLHLPVDDESHILSHQLKGKTTCGPVINEKGLIDYDYHDHPLVIINNDTTTSLHDPMKRIKLLCHACSKPITKTPFYKCSRYHDIGCDFIIHDWCTRLPRELRNPVAHPQHTLWLHKFTFVTCGVECNICRLPCNGFFYFCNTCRNFVIDANCAFIPKEITHEAHANHLLTRVDGASSSGSKIECRACRVSIDESKFYYGCTSCDFHLDCKCALHLPKTIRHKLDKHSLKLSYSPIEDYKGQYFCEVCEEDLDPGKWFYHCVECAQSIHSACAPLILQSEQGINSLNAEGVYKYINIRFGGVTTEDFHQHPVSLAVGTENDGLCQVCGDKLQYLLIWKCLQCNFACHGYHQYSDETVDKISEQIYLIVENKRTIKHHGPQTSLEFYPNEMIRPVTRDWKVVDDIH